MSRPDRESEWECGWEGHERAQRRRLSRLPFPDKLKWLEEAHDLVRRLQKREAEGERPPSRNENRGTVGDGPLTR